MQTKVTILLVKLKSVKNNANKSDNFTRQIEVCQSNVNKSDGRFNQV